MRSKLPFALCTLLLLAAGQTSAEVTFYDGEGFRGRSFTVVKEMREFGRKGIDHKASSAVVGNGRWEVCDKPRFEGRCVVLRTGGYDTFAESGLKGRIASVRPALPTRRAAREIAPAMAVPNYAWRRRANERTYEAQVTSVRAVVGTGSERCWTERQQAARYPRAATGGGEPAGVLGHQSGAGGESVGHSAVAGKADRCQSSDARAQLQYWDVIYSHQGIEHQVQLSDAPGKTIEVNLLGEPRQ